MLTALLVPLVQCHMNSMASKKAVACTWLTTGNSSIIIMVITKTKQEAQPLNCVSKGARVTPQVQAATNV